MPSNAGKFVNRAHKNLPAHFSQSLFIQAVDRHDAAMYQSLMRCENLSKLRDSPSAQKHSQPNAVLAATNLILVNVIECRKSLNSPEARIFLGKTGRNEMSPSVLSC
jgi:hypothetical protein